MEESPIRIENEVEMSGKLNPMEKRYPKIGVNVFVLKDAKLLLGKRIGKTGYGTWCLHGGHFEWSESLINAAARELER